MKISVIIITHNRADALRKTLKAYYSQSYDNFEIIIADNASTDNTATMVKQEFPKVNYIYLPDNLHLFGANLAMSRAKGDIIWRTDDDSNPEDIHTFQNVVNIFDKFEDIDIIATEDIEVRSGNKIWNWYPFEVNKQNVPDKGYPSNKFHGTGAAIRKRVFDKIGGYWGWGHEELDFSTRAIINGFIIRYFPDIRVLHYAYPAGRDKPARWIKLSQMLIRYQMKYFPTGRAIGRTFLIYFNELFLGVLRGVPFSAFLENAFGMLSVAFKTYREERNPIPNDKLDEVTMGKSTFKDIVNYYKHLFKTKLSK